MHPLLAQGLADRNPRPFRRRKSRVGRYFGLALVWFAVSFTLALPAGWALMLAVGVIHHEWIPQCPTIGFWWSALLAFLFRAALTTAPNTSKD